MRLVFLLGRVEFSCPEVADVPDAAIRTAENALAGLCVVAEVHKHVPRDRIERNVPVLSGSGFGTGQPEPGRC